MASDMDSARMDGKLVVITVEIPEGSADGAEELVRRTICPSCNFWAAVMVESVAGARVSSSVGSATISVDTNRLLDTAARSRI